MCSNLTVTPLDKAMGDKRKRRCLSPRLQAQEGYSFCRIAVAEASTEVPHVGPLLTIVTVDHTHQITCMVSYHHILDPSPDPLQQPWDGNRVKKMPGSLHFVDNLNHSRCIPPPPYVYILWFQFNGSETTPSAEHIKENVTWPGSGITADVALITFMPCSQTNVGPIFYRSEFWAYISLCGMEYMLNGSDYFYGAPW